jgi:hypothetical protein
MSKLSHEPFDSLTPPQIGRANGERFMRTIPSAPPDQALLTRSGELLSAQSPAPRGAFCFCVLTDPMAAHPRKPSQTPFRLRTS